MFYLLSFSICNFVLSDSNLQFKANVKLKLCQNKTTYSLIPHSLSMFSFEKRELFSNIEEMVYPKYKFKLKH